METPKTMTAEEVKRALKARGLNQHALARALGVSQPLVSLMLAGDMPLSAERKRAFEHAIVALKLNEPTASHAYPPVFSVPVEPATE